MMGRASRKGNEFLCIYPLSQHHSCQETWITRRKRENLQNWKTTDFRSWYVLLDMVLINPCHAEYFHVLHYTGPHSAVGNTSGNRCESDCRSRGRKFNPGPVPYFPGDWSRNDFYGHSSPFRWIIQGLLSVTSESMYMKYWLTACSSLPRKKCG